MSNFFDSIKGAASGIKHVASNYARDIVNEYMEGEGEGDDSNQAKVKVEAPQNTISKPKDADNFFSSFLPDVAADNNEEVKSQNNPFETFKKLAVDSENKASSENGINIEADTIDSSMDKLQEPINEVKHGSDVQNVGNKTPTHSKPIDLTETFRDSNIEVPLDVIINETRNESTSEKYQNL